MAPAGSAILAITTGLLLTSSEGYDNTIGLLLTGSDGYDNTVGLLLTDYRCFEQAPASKFIIDAR